MTTGAISKIVADRGFAFISLDNGDRVFLHHTELPASFDSLSEGDRVSFEIADSPKGPRATRVSLAPPQPAEA